MSVRNSPFAEIWVRIKQGIVIGLESLPRTEKVWEEEKWDFGVGLQEKEVLAELQEQLLKDGRR